MSGNFCNHNHYMAPMTTQLYLSWESSFLSLNSTQIYEYKFSIYN